MKKDSIVGCILGTAVGDAMGLPYEGMSSGRIHKMFSGLTRYHFLFGRGMVSDDTEHICFVAEALFLRGTDPEKYERCLAWSLRWWFVSLPAGIGMATLKSVIRLWLGIPPGRSGVYSAGNGPAMRSTILGVVFGCTQDDLKEFVIRTTRLTHSDPRAYFGAVGVALAAYQSTCSARTSPSEYVNLLRDVLKEQESEEFLDLIEKAANSADMNEELSVFAGRIGCVKGISGYMYHTVPCVIQTWLRYQNNFIGGMHEILSVGGDTDTTGAILGGIIGAGVGKKGIPGECLDGIMEWPRSIAWMENLGTALEEKLNGNEEVQLPGYFRPGILLRNIFFLIVVLLHGVRRLLPPY